MTTYKEWGVEWTGALVEINTEAHRLHSPEWEPSRTTYNIHGYVVSREWHCHGQSPRDGKAVLVVYVAGRCDLRKDYRQEKYLTLQFGVRNYFIWRDYYLDYCHG